MKEEAELNAASADQLGEEDVQELTQNIKMNWKKDPLDSSTTTETALESTPIFHQTVTSRGYDPQKDQWSLETERAELEHEANLLRLQAPPAEARTGRQRRRRRSRKNDSQTA